MVADSPHIFLPTGAGVYTLGFQASDGANTSPTYTVTLTATGAATASNMPSARTAGVPAATTAYDIAGNAFM